MGYETKFEISTKPKLPYISLDGYLETDNNGCLEYCGKWYNSKEDILKVSKIYPDTLFEVTGFGEDPLDIWRAYIKNGKIQLWELEKDIDKLADKYAPEKLK